MHMKVSSLYVKPVAIWKEYFPAGFYDRDIFEGRAAFRPVPPAAKRGGSFVNQGDLGVGERREGYLPEAGLVVLTNIGGRISANPGGKKAGSIRELDIEMLVVLIVGDHRVEAGPRESAWRDHGGKLHLPGDDPKHVCSAEIIDTERGGSLFCGQLGSAASLEPVGKEDSSFAPGRAKLRELVDICGQQLSAPVDLYFYSAEALEHDAVFAGKLGRERVARSL